MHGQDGQGTPIGIQFVVRNAVDTTFDGIEIEVGFLTARTALGVPKV